MMKSSRQAISTIIFGLACCMFSVMVCADVARSNSKPSPTDAIVKSIKSFAAAFNAGDAKKLAAHFAEDGEYVDDAGTLFKGRANIEEEFAAFFKVLPGAHLAVDVEQLRFVGDSMEIGRAHV